VAERRADLTTTGIEVIGGRPVSQPRDGPDADDQATPIIDRHDFAAFVALRQTSCARRRPTASGAPLSRRTTAPTASAKPADPHAEHPSRENTGDRTMVNIKPIGVVCDTCAVIIANGDDSMYDIEDEATAAAMRKKFEIGLAGVLTEADGRHAFVGDAHDYEARKNPFRHAFGGCACFRTCDVCGHELDGLSDDHLHVLMAEIIPHLGGFQLGDRVRTRPGSDAFMRGARYGEIVKVGTKYLHVHLWLHTSRDKPWRFLPDTLVRDPETPGENAS
jgi:hypothetical protein